MKYSDMKDMSVVELKKKKAALTAEIFESKIKNSLGQLANPLQIRALRKDVARLSTVLAQKVVR